MRPGRRPGADAVRRNRPVAAVGDGVRRARLDLAQHLAGVVAHVAMRNRGNGPNVARVAHRVRLVVRRRALYRRGARTIAPHEGDPRPRVLAPRESPPPVRPGRGASRGRVETTPLRHPAQPGKPLLLVHQRMRVMVDAHTLHFHHHHPGPRTCGTRRASRHPIPTTRACGGGTSTTRPRCRAMRCAAMRVLLDVVCLAARRRHPRTRGGRICRRAARSPCAARG